jgi:hypothetical protein
MFVQLITQFGGGEKIDVTFVAETAMSVTEQSSQMSQVETIRTQTEDWSIERIDTYGSETSKTTQTVPVTYTTGENSSSSIEGETGYKVDILKVLTGAEGVEIGGKIVATDTRGTSSSKTWADGAIITTGEANSHQWGTNTSIGGSQSLAEAVTLGTTYSIETQRSIAESSAQTYKDLSLSQYKEDGRLAKYAFTEFASVGVFQVVDYDPVTNTVTATDEPLYYNVEDTPIYYLVDSTDGVDSLELPEDQRLEPLVTVNNALIVEDQLKLYIASLASVGTKAANTASTPYTVKLAQLETRDTAGAIQRTPVNFRENWGAINAEIQSAERYVTLNLRDCYATGNIVTGQSSPTGNDMNIIKDNPYIKGIILPDSVTFIWSYAFWGCSELTSVTIPSSVTSIKYATFSWCSGLTSVTIPSLVTSIEEGAFSNCSGLTAFMVAADNPAYFSENGVLYEYGTPVKIKLVPQKISGAIIIPNSVTSIGDSAFLGCSRLTSVTIPSSVTSIGDTAFRGCSGLTSVTIPSSVTSIGNYVFAYCSGLTGPLTIPNWVTSIGDRAFLSCSGLRSVTIPSSVTSIGGLAFYDCSGLTSVTFGGSGTTIGTAAFPGGDVIKLAYASGGAGTYKRASDGSVWTKQ